MPKIAVVTALFTFTNSTDKVCPQEKHPNWDYFLFTEQNASPATLAECERSNYTVIKVDISKFKNGLFATKHVKWLTHLYLPDYDFIIWVDCHVSPTQFGKIEDLIAQNHDICLRTQKFPCINNDIKWCIKHKRITETQANTIRDYLTEHNYDCTQHDQTYWSSAIIKKNKNVQLNQMSEELFQLVCDVGFRDQHWLPFLFKKYSIDAELMGDLFKVTGQQIAANHAYITNVQYT